MYFNNIKIFINNFVSNTYVLFVKSSCDTLAKLTITRERFALVHESMYLRRNFLLM